MRRRAATYKTLDGGTLEAGDPVTFSYAPDGGRRGTSERSGVQSSAESSVYSPGARKMYFIGRLGYVVPMLVLSGGDQPRRINEHAT